MSDILSASFPRVDPRSRIAALVHSCAMVSIVMFPLSIGLAVVAPHGRHRHLRSEMVGRRAHDDVPLGACPFRVR